MSGQPGTPSDRDIVAMLVERIAADPDFRQRLLDDPESATALLLGRSGATGDEVAGYMRADCKRTCFTTCKGGTGTCGPQGTCAATNARF